MGVKGDKDSKLGALTAELLTEKLISITGLSSKKMFGGYGFFCNDKMFGIVDSKGQAFFKADDTNRPGFEEKELNSTAKCLIIRSLMIL